MLSNTIPRRFPLIVPGAFIRSLANYVLTQCVTISKMEAIVQGSVAFGVACVDVCPAPQHRLGHPFVAVLAGCGEQCVAPLVPHIHGHAAVQHALDLLHAPVSTPAASIGDKPEQNSQESKRECCL